MAPGENAKVRRVGVDPGVLADMVTLEQAQLEVQDAVDEPAGLSPAALAALGPADWEDSAFEFARALRLVDAAADVLAVVDDVARGVSPSRPAPGRATYLVSRVAGAPLTERLRPDEAALMDALLAGRTFADACATAASHGGSDEASLVGAAVGLLVTASARGLVLRMRRRDDRRKVVAKSGAKSGA